MVKHADIFTGIGGWPLAASSVWGADHEPVVFCEQDKYCRRVLAKHWPDVPCVDDVFNMKGCDYEGLDLLTCSPPCQPFSQAGKRDGRDDARHIWPQVLRVVREMERKPTWWCIENVRGLLSIEDGLVFEQVCTDLEDAGYAVQPFVIPAVAVDAPHRRDRVWFVGKSTGGRECERQRERMDGELLPSAGREQGQHNVDAPSQDVSDTKRERGCSRDTERQDAGEFEPALGGLADELPAGLARFRWPDEPADVPRVATGVKDRVNKLKALGNSIVPAVAEAIFRAIKECE